MRDLRRVDIVRVIHTPHPAYGNYDGHIGRIIDIRLAFGSSNLYYVSGVDGLGFNAEYLELLDGGDAA